jgi:hypothetical protein
MSGASQGPGWWQASDLKWYPPASQPNQVPPPPPPPPPGQPYPTNPYAAAAQAPGIHTGPPPQVRPAPYPQNQAAGAQMASDGLATVKGLLANLSPTTVLLYGGLAIAVIGIFCPWVSVTFMGMQGPTTDIGPHTSWKYAALLVIIAAGWLAWPTLTVPGSGLPANRLIGLAGAAGVLGLVVVIGFYAIVSFSSGMSKSLGIDVSQIESFTPGWGLYMYAVAVIAFAVGVVRLWMQKPQTPGQAV